MNSNDVLEKIIEKLQKNNETPKGSMMSELTQLLQKNTSIKTHNVTYSYKKNIINFGTPICIDGMQVLKLNFSDLRLWFYYEHTHPQKGQQFIQKLKKTVLPDVNILILEDVFDAQLLGDLSQLKNCYYIDIIFSYDKVCNKIEKFPPNLKSLYVHNYIHPLDNLPNGFLNLRVGNYTSHLDMLPFGTQYVLIDTYSTFNNTIDNFPLTVKGIYIGFKTHFQQSINYLPIELEEFINNTSTFKIKIDNWSTNLKNICIINCDPESILNLPSKLISFSCFIKDLQIDKLELPPTCLNLTLNQQNDPDETLESKLKLKFPFLQKVNLYWYE